MNTTTLSDAGSGQQSDTLEKLPEIAISGAEEEFYRSVSRGAVTTVVLGVLGLLSFTAYVLVILPLVGVFFAIASLSAFRKYPDELLGKPLAKLGLGLCVFTLLAAPSWHVYVYLTEVPEGYSRVDFAILTSAKDEADKPSQEALELDGEQVFIKGYIHPSSMDTMMAKRFVLVPDLGTCCFGGQPPLTHMIEVTLSGDQYASKSLRKQRLAGTLEVNPNLKPVRDLTGVFYHLRADILK